MHQPMFPANGSLILNGASNGTPKAFSDDTKILGYDPVIMPALIYAELPLVHCSQVITVLISVERKRGTGDQGKIGGSEDSPT
jgi:hypothetical protein